MVQTPSPPPCTPSGISICLPVDFGGPPASPQLLEPPLTSPRPPSHGAVALSSILLAMRAATLDEACLLSFIITNGAARLSSIKYACTAGGQCMVPLPDRARAHRGTC